MPVDFPWLVVGGDHEVLWGRGSVSFLYASFLLEMIFLKTETLFVSVSTVALTPRSVLNNEDVALHWKPTWKELLSGRDKLLEVRRSQMCGFFCASDLTLLFIHTVLQSWITSLQPFFQRTSIPFEDEMSSVQDMNQFGVMNEDVVEEVNLGI